MIEKNKPEACEFCKSGVYMSGVVMGVECIEFRCGTEWDANSGFEQCEECRVLVLQQLLAEAHEAFQNITIAANDIGDRTNADYAREWVSRLSEFEQFYPTT